MLELYLFFKRLNKQPLLVLLDYNLFIAAFPCETLCFHKETRICTIDEMILFISFEFAPPQGFLGLAEFFLSDFVHDGK